MQNQSMSFVAMVSRPGPGIMKFLIILYVRITYIKSSAMKNVNVALLFLISLSGYSQNASDKDLAIIPSTKYSWKTPDEKAGKNIRMTELFEGSGHDMEYVQMMCVDLQSAKKKTNVKVPADEEHLLIIKSGKLTISFRDSTWALGPGSIALLMPNEKYSILQLGQNPCRYYRMAYRSRSPVDMERGLSSGGSFVRDWNQLPFIQHARGGTRRYFERATAMSKRFEMHVTTLKEGLKSHEPHTHRAEEIILMLEDESQTEMLIGENFEHGEAGDIYYVGSNIRHGIKNTGSHPCSYFAFQFE